MSSGADLSGTSLLAVFAHPDDESIACGGMIAHCADLGARVTLICATHGENRSGVRDTDLYEQRPRELAAAASVLGICDVVLLEYRDGFLPWAGDLSDRLEQEIVRLRPDAVVTFGKDGLYWHPDHIAVCEATTAAVDALGPDGPALYYVTMPPGQMRLMVDAVMPAQVADLPAQLLGVANPDAFGVGALEPTLVFDCRRYASRKLAALRCHHSQVAGGAFARISDADAERYLGVEHFHRPAGSRVRSRVGLIDQLCT